jgi:hypothetical protein
VTYLRVFSEFEGYEFQFDNFLECLKRIIFNMTLLSSVDNPNGIYEYDIDSEIIKIEKLLFKFVFRAGEIFWI